MTLKFYNTLTRKKEEFKPINKGIVLMYSCGPTVYDYAHIGNFRTYIFQDILQRYLEYKGFKVKHVMNITDIDDKTIKRSAKLGMSLKDFAEKYTKEFFRDIDTLNIKRASVYPRATEHIKDMVRIASTLIKKGYAYEKLHSVYYDISEFKDYGKLSKVDLSQMKAGARVDLDEYEKEHPGDFTLMKRSKLDELKKGIFYETDWGKVRPGWHLECSAMSMKHLGETFDIHTGGVDLIFPHHENEIAQSEAATGKQFVRYWLHAEHLLVEGKKMSKSLGNFYTLRDLLEKGHDPKAIRYILMVTHYKQKLNFTFEELDAAKNTVDRFFEFEDRLKTAKGSETNVSGLVKKVKTGFEKAMDDDLDINTALASVFDFMHEANKLIDSGKISKKNAKELLTLLNNFDKVLGILEMGEKEIDKELGKKVQELIKKREKARAGNDFKTSDKIRNELIKMGVEVQDTKQGPKWRIK